MSFCARCREKARAFIRKPEDAKPGEVSPAVRLASAAAATCLLCGGSWSPAIAAGNPVTYSVIHVADPVVRPWAPGPADPGDHEPPHDEGPKLTRDGSAPT